MEKAKIMQLILILVLMRGEIRQTNADDHLCCNDHSAVGKCIPGVDDWPGNSTKLPGKCFRFCFEGCRIGKGGYCKPIGQEHICHCCLSAYAISNSIIVGYVNEKTYTSCKYQQI
ncbi:hypothetical protein Tsubulata_034903 [Turnera subulata]|uniref:Knottin scorpion toxin-like domain-containing protein n=1 Tax=Turnera subulata TaxID=218843 RepID=A0A9Q0FY28_9ROSI|nr:hypothetical protein Tsubulata_034903 [Turnera subulata]